MNKTMNDYPAVMRSLIRLLFAFALVAALIITKSLLVPLFWAILFAYLLYPSANWLERHNISRIVTNLILIIGSVTIILGIVYFLAVLTATFTADLPQIQQQFQQNIQRFQVTLGNAIGISKSQQNTIFNSLSSSGKYLTEFFAATANSILAIGLIPVYTFLILFYRNKFRKFISMLVKSDQEETVEKITRQASEVVPKYLKGLFIVCFILIGLNSLGFYIIGVKYALLLGIIAAVFNLIPYLGTVLGYGVVLIFVLSTQSPSLALGVFFQFFVIQFIENNILTPNITGSYVEINPLVTILSLIAGGMIWGLPGMFMIIPYLAILKIACENIPSLQPIGFLLGTRGTERYSITIKSLKRRFGWSEED